MGQGRFSREFPEKTKKTDPNQVLLRTGHLSQLGHIKSSGPPQS
jgi:hypothetical protein